MGSFAKLLDTHPQPLAVWVRIPGGVRTLMWGGLPADMRCAGGSTQTYVWSSTY